MGAIEPEHIQPIIERVLDQMLHDLSVHGVHITRDGERIDPKDFYVK